MICSQLNRQTRLWWKNQGQKLLVHVGVLCGLAGLLVGTIPEARAGEASFGLMFEEFQLTLKNGTRTEAVGPLFYDEEAEGQTTWAVPPLFSSYSDTNTDSSEFDVLYPLLTYDRFGPEYRFQILQLFAFAGGGLQSGETKHRFTLFPFYFQQRSTATNQNYTSLFPIYGNLKNRLFREEIHFTLWPLYVKTIKRPGFGSKGAEELLTLSGNSWAKPLRGDITTYNFVAPIFHLRYGEGMRGWQFWPLAGHEQKVVTTRTNMWGDAESIPGYDKSFILWPLWLNETRDIGTTNTSRLKSSIPFYSSFHSPMRDSVSYLWPCGLTFVDDREKKYRETDVLWPIFVYARGEGKSVTRFWPLFGQAHSPILESDFYLWPVYKYNRLNSYPLDRERTRVFFFLYSNIRERNTSTNAVTTNAYSRRVDVWPLFTRTRDFDGSTRFQALSVIEPILRGKSIERNYSPLWALWRLEHNAKTDASSQSLLWNLYRHQVMADGDKKTSFLFGLFQHRSTPYGTGLRLFYIPVKKPREHPTAGVDSTNQMAHLAAPVKP